MFGSILIFLEKLIPIPLSMIHDSLLLSSLILFSSFKISAVALFTSMFLEFIELLLKLSFTIFVVILKQKLNKGSESEFVLFCSS